MRHLNFLIVVFLSVTAAILFNKYLFKSSDFFGQKQNIDINLYSQQNHFKISRPILFDPNAMPVELRKPQYLTDPPGNPYQLKDDLAKPRVILCTFEIRTLTLKPIKKHMESDMKTPTPATKSQDMKKPKKKTSRGRKSFLDGDSFSKAKGDTSWLHGQLSSNSFQSFLSKGTCKRTFPRMAKPKPKKPEIVKRMIITTCSSY